ncbi:cation:proton antiporter [Actinoplanes subtropicus]|uniref:cation:proton antiporter domain-containing protein n=1 Tax=Actinoplanes subtropicus TaxID=543632 RepID=UPI001FE1A660|nr:cation:proton antiporter [Actinoplanes subtropicus]
MLSNRISDRIRIPAPAIFLVAAAVASDLVPALGRVPVLTVQRVVTVMLILLLFDGGMHIGWRRFRAAGAAVLWIGVAGTAVTTLGVAVLAHLVFGFDWRAGLLLGIALAPTDPAVVFSVLGRREIAGRSGTLLEGESGANDPVGIAAMAAVLAAGTAGGWHAVGAGVAEFAVEMVVGAVAGVVGGYLLSLAMRRLPLPNGALYPLQTLLGAGTIYGLTTLAHGSGFLAVFVAGILVGDIRAPYKMEIERFHSSLASLAEIVAFAMLGLTVSLTGLAHGNAWLIGLALAVLLALLVRPVLVGLLLLPIHISRGERLFVMWSGLKGAVPILLGTYVLSAQVTDADRLYQIIVVVVAFSVIVQGGLIPAVARHVNIPMRILEPEPWALGMRFRDEPTGLRRYQITAGAPADGCTIADLALGEDAWISMINRGGLHVPVRGDTVLQSGDEVLLQTEPHNGTDPQPLFTQPRA